jgi:Flp pilus assembly CpaE family ATPase
MSETPLQILLVEDNPGDALLVQEMLSDADAGVFEMRRAASLLEGLDALAERSADVVLLDLNLPDSHGLETFSSLRKHAPEIPVVLLTGHDDDSLALSAVEEGAQDYLVKDRLEPETLLRAVRYAVVRQQRGGPPSTDSPGDGGGRMIGVIGAKGGVGTTTVACHLAAALQGLSGGPVLLADADVDGGTAGFLMQAKSPYTLLDAVDNVYRLDEGFWRSLIHETGDGVHVITSPALLGRVAVKETGRLRHVLRFARSLYPWAVVDLGRLTAVAAAVLTEIDRLLLVSTSDLMSAHDAGRVAESLTGDGIEPGRLSLIHNHASRGAAGTDVLEAVVKLPIVADMPASDKEMTAAYTRGVLVDPSSAFGREVTKLAATVSGLQPAGKGASGFSLKNLPLFGKREAAEAKP